MSSIFATLIFVGAVKLGFLWVFDSKCDRKRPVADSLSRPEISASLVEIHDGRGVVSSLRFEVQGMDYLEDEGASVSFARKNREAVPREGMPVSPDVCGLPVTSAMPSSVSEVQEPSLSEIAGIPSICGRVALEPTA